MVKPKEKKTGNLPLYLFHQGTNLSLIHISEPTRQAEISYAVFCLKKKKIYDDITSLIKNPTTLTG